MEVASHGGRSIDFEVSLNLCNFVATCQCLHEMACWTVARSPEPTAPHHAISYAALPQIGDISGTMAQHTKSPGIFFIGYCIYEKLRVNGSNTCILFYNNFSVYF
ncbi:hypothetical protein L484_005175 [Morus notabilis]|uniref:Uncharacterized protein n=1 Tax=Morus notabilis TaxID=981085 RepID=W9QX21_9ROSA|nr:hypothetical protein L484_005175 [Morus notabilis]